MTDSIRVTQEDALAALEVATGRIENFGHYVAQHGRDGRWSPDMAFEILTDLYKAVTGEDMPGASQ